MIGWIILAAVLVWVAILLIRAAACKPVEPDYGPDIAVDVDGVSGCLPPEEPAIGVILSESMQYLVMGKWWLALFPGLLLAGVVLLFHFLGQGLLLLLDPEQAHS